MEPSELYARIKGLVSQWPPIEGRGRIPDETYEWLGKMAPLIAEANIGTDQHGFTLAMESLGGALHDMSAAKIRAIVYRALAVAESRAPVPQQGAFIAAGSPFQVLAELGKILRTAKSDVLIVDPYIDSVALSDVAVLVPENVPVRLLGDRENKQANLLPAVTRWATQYPARPVQARLAAKRSMHDRLIVIDAGEVWSLSQSIKDFAGRAPATIERSNAEIAGRKRDAYFDAWDAATPLN